MIKRLFIFYITLVWLQKVNCQNWTMLDFNYGYTVYQPNLLNVVNTSTVYTQETGGWGSEISKTLNGGANWTALVQNQIYYAYAPSVPAYEGMSMFSSNIGYVCTSLGSASVAKPIKIWKTLDGGATWVNVFNNTQGNVEYFKFFDENNGILVLSWINNIIYNYRVFKTTDGGATFTQIPDTLSPISGGYSPIKGGDYTNGVLFLNDIFLQNGQYKMRIYKSNDQGTTWSQLPNVFNGSDWNLTAWSDEDKGIVVEQKPGTPSFSKLKRTLDGGLTWSEIPYNGIPTQCFNNIAYVPNSNVVILVGRNESVTTQVAGSWISYDNGNTWSDIDSSINYHRTIECLSDGICYSGGTNYAQNKTFMYKMNVFNLSTKESVENKEQIYPNPVSDILNIKTTKEIKNSILIDTVGRIVLQTKLKEINMQSLKNGIYILVTQFRDGTESTQKIVKE